MQCCYSFTVQQDTITRLLYSLGTKREVERHLRIFSSSSHPSQPAKFAVIKVGGAVLDQLDELSLSLSFLYRVGLYPVVLHGGGPQLNEIIEGEGVIPDYIDGIRVTGTPSGMSRRSGILIIRDQMQKHFRLPAASSLKKTSSLSPHSRNLELVPVLLPLAFSPPTILTKKNTDLSAKSCVLTNVHWRLQSGPVPFPFLQVSQNLWMVRF